MEGGWVRSSKQKVDVVDGQTDPQPRATYFDDHERRLVEDICSFLDKYGTGLSRTSEWMTVHWMGHTTDLAFRSLESRLGLELVNVLPHEIYFA